MIKNNDQLEQTQKALGHAERALGYLIQEKGSLHPSRFAVMAEGDIRDIWTLRREIDEYLGVKFTVEECPYPQVNIEAK
ncbi:MAG: hypothetical protein DMG14_21315 [Acidobacteria bacterium]|nr:MAG: hypothetical protein DMG14_21315 [Acidobacteriota bacterium]